VCDETTQDIFPNQRFGFLQPIPKHFYGLFIASPFSKALLLPDGIASALLVACTDDTAAGDLVASDESVEDQSKFWTIDLVRKST